MSFEAPPQQTLSSIQALRGLAACLVVLFHAAEIWREMTGHGGLDGFWDRGWAGVDLFFVISGFVMVWVAGERPAGPSQAGRFLFDRATRIYPLWWVFCALMAVYFLLTYGQPATPAHYDSGEAVAAFVQSMALWPTGDLPVLTVGWTLTFEIAFYALFAALLFLPPRWRMPAILLWGGVLAITWWLSTPRGLPENWMAVLLSPLCLEFVFGACAAWVIQRRSAPRSIAIMLTGIGGLAFTGLLVFSANTAGMFGVGHRVLTFGLTATVLMSGLVLIERNGGLHAPKWLLAIGDASYTLYLSHLLVLLTLKRLIEPLDLFATLNPMLMLLFILFGTGLSLIVAIIGYRLLERPLLRVSRRLLPQKGDGI